MGHFAKPRFLPGFTLVEVLVTVAIVGMALVLIYDVAQLTQHTYLLGERRAELTQNGRVIMDRLIREFRQAPELLTALPDIPNDPFFTPPQEISFRNGHQLDPITYIRYWFNPIDKTLNRQFVYYSFSSDPATYVPYNALDGDHNPPDQHILQDQIIGEYINNFKVWGGRPVTTELELRAGDTTLKLRTNALGRNL